MGCCTFIKQATAYHSTDTCLSRLTDIISNDAENRKHTGMILIDL